MRIYSAHDFIDAHILKNTLMVFFNICLQTNVLISLLDSFIFSRNKKQFTLFTVNLLLTKDSNTQLIHTQKSLQGFTFIETLVALFLLVTGILSTVTMQITSQQSSFDAMQRTIATLYAQDIIQRIKSNTSALTTLEQYQGEFGSHKLIVEPSKRCNTITSDCNAQDRVLNDLYEWNQLLIGANVKSNNMNVGGLVQSMACIKHSAGNITISISWSSQALRIESTLDDLNELCGIGPLYRRQIIVSTSIY